MMELDIGRMTALSGAAFDAATQSGVSPEAATALLEQVQIRTFRDVLTAFGGEDVRGTLVKGLCLNDPARSREAMDKKVRGWLGGKYQPTKREDLLELCFVLGLDVPRADAFLAMTGEAGLHWRDPREAVYAFALGQGSDYPQAKALLERVMPDGAAADDGAGYTAAVRQQVLACRSEAELRQYLAGASAQLGSLHNTAYRYFCDMLQTLEQPADDGERRYTTREIVETYLDRRLPPARAGKGLEERRRCILADWPDEVVLSRMKNRKADVTRKVLLLLFLATDGAEEESDPWQEDWYDEDWDEGDDADAAFRSSYMRLNRMLAECGMRMLDPRNAFDWLAIYCMRVGDADDMAGLNERLTQALAVLFAASQQA